jgi:hypothetical protein
VIPTREQFLELHNALNNNVEFIQKRLKYPLTFNDRDRADLVEVMTEEELKKFIKCDVESYLEQAEVSQQLIAWKWLHSQENFNKAKGRIFDCWPPEENPASDLVMHIAKYTIKRYLAKMEERAQLIAVGREYADRTYEAWVIDREPIEIFQSALANSPDKILLYRRWIAGVAIALSNYHYGKTAEMAIDRKNRVGELITAWENFSEQVALSQADPEIGEYLFPTILKVRDDRKLMALRELHQGGALYFIGRADETVSERLFVRELALLHRKLLYRPYTSAISDLFYLEGMKSAPTERAIQRIAKSAIANRKEIGRVESEVFKRQRH